VNAAKSCDPEGLYVRRWVPELSEVPLEPWQLHPGRFSRPILGDLDEARRQHCRHVLEVRRRHPDMISRTGHEWLRLPGRRGLLAKLVTRQEFRADTEDFIFYQGRGKGRDAQRVNDAGREVFEEEVERYGPGL
ncbi:unnamed protein product, partial [Effrenium voratum]